MGLPSATVNLTSDEHLWMLNEQLMVMCDAEYALTRYCFVKNEEGVIQRFAFRMPQRILYSLIADLEDQEAAIEIMILKARQLGMSTLVELLIAHRIIFGYGVNAIMASADQTKTGLMAGMLFTCYDMLPFWLRPTATRRVESDRGMLVFGQNMTGVSFQHGTQTSGIARGTTPTIYHLSEVASFGNPEIQIEAALFKCVHPSPAVLGVLESTGEGDKGWWPDTWRYSKENWQYGRARLCPLFLPYYCGINMYPKPTWLRTRPVPHNWRPNLDTRKHVAKSELFVRSNQLLERYLIEYGQQDAARAWRMPLEQQWWWEVNHEEAKSKGLEAIFLQEYCGDDEEALQRSSESVFGHETIEVLDSNRESTYELFGLTGQSIEADHEPPTDTINYQRERIVTTYASPVGGRYRWDLVPLRFDPPLRESDPADADNKLIVFHHPQPGKSYSIGADTSGGQGDDSTVISVWDLGQRGGIDIQCAEFASSHVNHVEAWAFVLAIASYYGKFMSQGVTRWKEPYVSIEQIAAVGDTCQLQMRRMGYSTFHRMVRYDSKRISKARAPKMGWYTTGWSRPLLTTNFVHSTQNGWSQINSPWLIEEMKSFEAHVTSTGRRKLEHEDGAHDDRIFAAAMAIFCPHDLDVIAERSKKRSIISAEALPPIDLGQYRGHTVSPAEARGRAQMSLQDVLYADTNLSRYRG
jgi:hypothetical protein